MKNKRFEKFIFLLQGISLHKSEREVMHERILEYTRMKPMRNPIQNDSEHLLKDNPLSTKKKRMSTIITIIVALTAGVGTSFAAEGTLPGDTLYPVKVGVNERIRGAVAFSSEAEADLQSRLAERRMEEAVRLASEDRLNADARAELETRFTTHTEKAAEALERMEARGGSEVSAEIGSKLEASLRAHENMLEQIAEQRADVRAEVLSLNETVRSRMELVTEARARSEANASVEANANLQARAEAQQKVSERAIENARKHIEKNTRLSAEAKAEAEARLDDAAEIHALAEARMEAGEYNEAFLLFRQAVRSAHEVSVYANTSTQIDLEIGLGATPSVNTTIQNNARLIQSVRVREDTQTNGSIDVQIDGGNGSIDVDISEEGSTTGSIEINQESRIDSDGNTQIDVNTNTNVRSDTRGTEGNANAQSQIRVETGL